VRFWKLAVASRPVANAPKRSQTKTVIACSALDPWLFRQRLLEFTLDPFPSGGGFEPPSMEV
jgi:hypothetical protein